MAILINDNYSLSANKPFDARYLNIDTPWVDVPAVLAGIPTYRYIGLTVNVNGVEYWWKNGITNTDLVIKTAGGTITGGTCGLHTVGQNILLGGTFTGATLTGGVLNYGGDYSSGYTNYSIPDVAYVNSLANGLKPKASVKVATTGDTVLVGLSIVDGIQLYNGDRVLVKNQALDMDNGVYVVASTGWTHASDMPLNATGLTGSYMWVLTGTTNAHTSWVLTSSNPIGTSGTTFVLFNQTLDVSDGTGIHITTSGTTNVISLNAATQTVVNSALTGGTNGIGHTGRKACLGGTLNANTSITGSSKLTLGATRTYLAIDPSVCRIVLGDCTFSTNYISIMPTSTYINSGLGFISISGAGEVGINSSNNRVTIGTTSHGAFILGQCNTNCNVFCGAGGTGLEYSGLTVNNSWITAHPKALVTNEWVMANVSGGTGGIAWTGSTVNGVGVYVNSSKICSQPNMTFNGNTLCLASDIAFNNTAARKITMGTSTVSKASGLTICGGCVTCCGGTGGNVNVCAGGVSGYTGTICAGSVVLIGGKACSSALPNISWGGCVNLCGGDGFSSKAGGGGTCGGGINLFGGNACTLTGATYGGQIRLTGGIGGGTCCFAQAGGILLNGGCSTCGNGGGVNLCGGNGGRLIGAAGGFVNIYAGNATSTGCGGGMNMCGGYSSLADGGCVYIVGGCARTSGYGGNVTICGGNSCCGTAPGDIIIWAGRRCCGATCYGNICLCGLSPKTSETCTVYISAAGKLSYALAGSGSGSTYSFNNGLTESIGIVGLGGDLCANTAINTCGNSMCITGLPVNVSGTCVVYIDGNGKLSTGIVSGGTGGGTITGATNGLSISGKNIGLGGVLTGDTIIAASGYCYTLSGGTCMFLGTCQNGASYSYQRQAGYEIVSCACIGDGTLQDTEIYQDGSHILFCACDAGYGCITCINENACEITISSTNSSFVGAQYASDYSANYTCLSLINAGWVTGCTTCAITIAPNAITGATNGLCKYDCHNVCLGGQLSTSTTIDLNGEIFTICGTVGSVFIELNDPSISACFGTSKGGSTTILRNDCYCFTFDYSGAIFTDTNGAAAAGLRYNGDYSANYTCLSIPNAGWVTGHTSGGGTITGATNGLNINSGKCVGIGGNLTGTTLVNLNGNYLYFSGDSGNIILTRGSGNYYSCIDLANGDYLLRRQYGHYCTCTYSNKLF